MADTEVNVALTALIVAAIALLIAIGQLLQQIFGTAEGYRKCQSSVIGNYATKTRLKWRWKEFRFETRYTTPSISLQSMAWVQLAAQRPERVTGTPESLEKTLISDTRRQRFSQSQLHDEASWLPLLEDLHVVQKSWYRWFRLDRNNPVIQLQERSWDFAPPDIVKPLASSTIGAMIVLAHRLGMRWFDFRPSEGIMQAESQTKILTSTFVRSLGIVFQYVNFERGYSTRSTEPRNDENLLRHDAIWQLDQTPSFPQKEVDMLMFGIIHYRSFVSNFHQSLRMAGPGSSFHSMLSSLRILGVDEQDLRTNPAKLPNSKEWKFSLSDLPGLLMDFVPPKGNVPSGSHTTFTVPSPYRWRLESPISWRVGRLCLTERLRRHVASLGATSPQASPLKTVLETVDQFEAKQPNVWGTHAWWDNKGRSEAYLHACRQAFDRTCSIYNDYVNRFLKGNNRSGTLEGSESVLVAVHLTALLRFGDRQKRDLKDEDKKPEKYGIQGIYSHEFLEYSLVYANNVANVVTLMKEKGYDNEDEVVVAWWTLMFRGIWWFMAINKGEPSRVQIDSAWWESNLPVWIS